MKALEALIEENENWLVDRVVHYALVEGFSAYTSTLREAWRASICGLSGPILQALAAIDTDAGPRPNDGFGEARKSIVAFGVEQAARHRARGVRLAEFLGLLKYYRRAYLDLIDENFVKAEDARRYRGCILEFFDQIEIGMCTEWNAIPNEDRLRDLQYQNQRLTNEKNKYLTIFESIDEPVILLDVGGTPVHLNDAAHSLFCGDVAPGASYYGALRSPLLNAQITEILKGSSNGRADMVVETLAGERDFKVKVQRMLDVSRKFDGTVIILNDVSEYKRALRQARAADHAKSTFLAAVSHEIRTPIAGALGLSKLLRDTPLTQEQVHFLDGIISSAELLEGVVGDILDFSHADLGSHPPAPQDFDLSQLVRQVMMVVEALAREKSISLSADIAPELPSRLHGDASMIRQVLLNLTHNAVKFTDVGSIRIAVSAHEQRLRFEVQDTGLGLPPGSKERLFDPFWQGDSHGDRASAGLGLGLAICRKIVVRMGGTIDCRANPAGGSIFRFEIPLVQARDEEVVPVLPRTTRSLRVLVVDDDDVSRMVAEGFLARLGHTSLAVSSAAEALRILEEKRFDLVLTDNRMPDMSGLDLVDRLRALADGPNVGIPAIVVTASADDFATDHGQGGRPGAFLTKPYDAEALSAEIARLFLQIGDGPEQNSPQEHSTDMPVDDLTVVSRHIDSVGRDRAGRVIQAFLESAPRLVRSIETGLAGNDREAVAAAAHSLAGASSLLGLASVESLARRIETCAKDPAVAVPPDLSANLKERVAQASRSLRTFC
ncbi:hybrid sensor histidine kinase/response regulator [Tropicimonas isoalkanivorans]|uniref:histidine kinase n=1 Tax=Tropicimonas isoalkanivorans TaxID=441112 RepID=A0A1I1KMR0_9RHOB|nr:ATP-binding protein [Tropicimonas isoalkanivorans]SFC62166.1 Hpt sensor hybrid histidine kinase [Tropicimonas isoalkanivorans]